MTQAPEKKGKHVPPTRPPQGTISIDPPAPQVAQEYAVSGAGLPANMLLNLAVFDGQGTTMWSIQTDAAGNAAVPVVRSYNAGEVIARFQHYDGHKTIIYAETTYEVG